MSEPLVIVGNGMAAARLCEELARRAPGRYAVAVIGEEPRLAYNRVLLSSVLAGEIAASDISLKPASWWSDRGVTLCYGAGVTAVDVAARMSSGDSATTEESTQMADAFVRASESRSAPVSYATPIVFVVDDDISVRESLELLICNAGWQPEIWRS